MGHRLIAPLLAVALLMVGCAGQPKQDIMDRNWQDRSAQLQLLDRWKADGKMALRNDQRSESANIAWSQEKNETRLNLSGPMGLSATTIYSDGRSLEVNRAGKTRRYDISTPEAMISDTGWDLPLHALHHWLKGVPSPALDIDELVVEQGLLERLSQSGWVISYESYGQFGQYTLPTKLKIEREDSRLRLIIRKWTIEAA